MTLGVVGRAVVNIVARKPNAGLQGTTHRACGLPWHAALLSSIITMERICINTIENKIIMDPYNTNYCGGNATGGRREINGAAGGVLKRSKQTID